MASLSDDITPGCTVARVDLHAAVGIDLSVQSVPQEGVEDVGV